MLVPSQTDRGKAPCRGPEDCQFAKVLENMLFLSICADQSGISKGSLRKRPVWNYIKVGSLFCKFGQNWTGRSEIVRFLKKSRYQGQMGRIFWRQSRLERTMGWDHAGRLNSTSLQKCMKSELFLSVCVDQSGMSEGGWNRPPGTI